MLSEVGGCSSGIVSICRNSVVLTPGTDVKIYVRGGLTLLKDKYRTLGNISV